MPNDDFLYEAVRELHGAMDHLISVVEVHVLGDRPDERAAILEPVHKALVASAFFMEDARRQREAREPNPRNDKDPEAAAPGCV